MSCIHLQKTIFLIALSFYIHIQNIVLTMD